MPLPEQLPDLLFGAIQRLRAYSLHHDRSYCSGKPSAEEISLCGSDRYINNVILIHTHHGLTFSFQNAYDGEGRFFDPYLFVQRIVVTKETFRYCLSDHTYLGCAANFLLIEVSTGSQSPVANFEHVFIGSINSCRPVLITVDNLRTAVEHRSGCLDGGAFISDGICVGAGQILSRAAGQADAAAGRGARDNYDQVASDGGNLFGNFVACAFADGQHGNYRGDADNNAQHRQAGTHFVYAKCAQ